jgi:predicted short-subunit dehydrogenase-like oxidoreductase (DUF2520 family)
MTGPPRRADMWIVGAGRAGLALGLLLWRRGAVTRLHLAGRRAEPPAHPLFHGAEPPATYAAGLALPPFRPDGVVLAVPDGALAGVAEGLASAGLPVGTPVLHLSGVHGAAILRPLADAGCDTGAMHPLAAVADPVAGAERLRGAWWGVEAEGAALAFAERIVTAAEGRVLRVAPGGKALYHAAAVFASNHVVALLGAAEAMMTRAGVEPESARAALCALAAGAVDNVAEAGPAHALTGPVARGDAETLRLHVDALSPGERFLYFPLAGAALGLARRHGLDHEAARRIERFLEEHR